VKKPKKFAISLLISLPAIGVLALCIFTFFRIVDYVQIGQCDFDDYLNDPQVERRFSDAITNFESKYRVDLGDGLSSPTCTRSGRYRTWLTYRTPTQLSKFGIVYELQLWGYYDPHTGNITLEIFDWLSGTQEVLAYIQSLQPAITEFENNPQVGEFAQQFIERGIGIDGIILRDELWIESDRRISWVTPSLVANIFFSIPRRAIRSYTLPNRFTWQEFTEFTTLHNIVNEKLLVGELSDCSISTHTDTQSTTTIFFHPESGLISAGTRVSCGNEASEKYLSIILHSDGTYEVESIK
jgi:hypothetical protein